MLEEIYQKFDELDKQKEIASEKLKTAQDQNGENEIEREGKKVPENYLWKEVFQLGPGCDAGKILKEKYPDVFEAYDKEGEIAKELNTLLSSKFGIASYNRISFKDILTVVEAVVDYKNGDK